MRATRRKSSSISERKKTLQDRAKMGTGGTLLWRRSSSWKETNDFESTLANGEGRTPTQKRMSKGRIANLLIKKYDVENGRGLYGKRKSDLRVPHKRIEKLVSIRPDTVNRL